MKKMLLVIVTAAFFIPAQAQFIKRMADRAKNRIEQKAGEKVDKGVDDAVDPKKKPKKTSEDKNDADESASAETDEGATSDESASTSTSASAPSSEKKATLQTYSKYDFVPGEKVIAYEDFSTAEIGDFPTRWNTNATGEVVTVGGMEGKWLKIVKEGIYHPEFITSLPENFTLEFDLGVNDKWNSWPLHLNIAKLKTPEEFKEYGHYVQWQGDHTVHINFKPTVKQSGSQANSALLIGKDGNHQVNNDVGIANWDNQNNMFAHVSIWRQKQRLRVYVNGEKIWDIPRGFDATASYNAITFACQGAYSNNQDFYLLSNIRLAVGAPDTRNKLITEGRFVTSGIHFDVNKADIRAESYGTLKDIANVLRENAEVKVNIIGHTDADGDDKANLELSKKRAEAVKAALNKDFGIDQSRMQTDGKGESQPLDKNDSEEGKANNRRVEFVKM